MPPAARITDMHTCPMVTPGVPPIPHVGGPILPAGAPTVLIGNLPAARVSDMATCVGPPDVIVKGSMTVLIGSLPAARMGDQTAHGGVIVVGFPTVMIGDSGSGSPGSGGAGASGAPGVSTRPVFAPGPGMSQDLASVFTIAGPAATAFTNAAQSGAALVCNGPCEACGRLMDVPMRAAEVAPPIEAITKTRKPSEAGFDEDKMYEIFSKSKTALALEKEVTALGYKYAGNVIDSRSSANTDIKTKAIRINKTVTVQEAALAYAYELKNAKNAPNYAAIFADARAGKVADGAEFARRVMTYEAEAIETEGRIAMELGAEKTQAPEVIRAIKDEKDPAERKKQILKWADTKGQIKGMKPSDYYKKMFDDSFAKPKK